MHPVASIQIFPTCNRLKVIRVAAVPITATITNVVKNMTIRDFTVKPNIRRAVRVDWFPLVADLSIASSVVPSEPEPAP
jgi:hypothetical protein